MSRQHNDQFPRPEEVIPHRPPHLWLDGIADVTETSAEGFWTPSAENFWGHFPGLELLPGVKQVESIAQLGAYTIMHASDKPLLPLFKGIEEVTFERPVRPGETMDLAVQIVDRDKSKFKGEGTAMVGGELACRATIVGVAMSERAALRLLGQ
jgi:3-hydroxyacyl-[acyl-carrier-protein] dehydratase